MDTVDSRRPNRQSAPAENATPDAADARSGIDWRLALGLVTFLLALLGQFYFKQVRSIVDGVVFFLLAVVAFLLLEQGSRRATLAPAPAGASPLDRALDWARRNPGRIFFIVAGFLIAFSAFFTLKGKPPGEKHWDVFALWVLSFAAYGLAFVRRPAWLDGRARERARAWVDAHWLEAAVVLAMTAVAFYIRLIDLGSIPNIISGDEGRLGTLAQSVERGELNNMFSTIFGHSTIYIYLLAGVMDLFGWTPAMLRITSAIGGALTVPALYLFGRRFFNRRVAFIAAALLTVSHIHVHFSRVIVAGGIQDALFAIIALYFLLSGLEERSVGRLVFSALVMGLHLYLYMGARLVILLVPVYLLVLLVIKPKMVRENLPGLAAFAGMLLIVALPMGYWAATHFPDFNARMNQTGVFQSGWLAMEVAKTGQSQPRILIDLLWQALLSINYYPAIAFYNARIPMLDMLTGAMFVLGLIYSLLHFTNPRHLLIQGLFWAGVVGGGALVVQPAISVYRILIVFPAVCLFVGLGFDRLVTYTLAHRQEAALGGAALTLAFVGAFSVINLRAYFKDYAPTCAYEDWSTRFASYVGSEFGRLGPEYAGYIVGNDRVWYGIHPSVDFLTNRRPLTNVMEPVTPASAFVAPGGKAVFFFTSERAAELPIVQQLLPGGEVSQIEDCGQPLVLIYRVDGPASGG